MVRTRADNCSRKGKNNNFFKNCKILFIAFFLRNCMSLASELDRYIIYEQNHGWIFLF